ncbi:MAG: hypothetical protein AAF993_21015 [Pseudomonadota bacterium]
MATAQTARATAQQIEKILQQQYHPEACADLDVNVTLDWQDDTLHFHLGGPELVFKPAPEPLEMIIYTRNASQLADLLQGQLNPVEAFTCGDLRSNGYLMWVFRVLASFPPRRAAD